MEPLGTAFLVFLTIGLVEVIKRALKLGKRWLPLIAVIFAVIIGLILDWGEFNGLLLVKALVIGLSACGLWDFGKKTLLGK